ncbi:hypothetical protein [Stenotrophomonas nitritireducens]|uniref:hypothetical protein n=1 Tax=Stenotrophomonas nitritireducens TaxID=83617 RepID=UPI003D9904DE
MFRKSFFLMVCLAPAVAFARQPELPLQAAQPFQPQQLKVRSDLQGGEVYSEISASDRERVIAALDRMSRAVGDGNVETLPPERRVEVFNDQELVNSVLTKARADSRLICKREKSVGSNMATTQCFTVAERERMKRDSDRFMGSMQGGKDAKVGN